MRWPTLEVEGVRVVGRRVVLVVERVAGTRHVPRPHSRLSSQSRVRWVYHLYLGHPHHVVPTLLSFVRAFYLPYPSYHQGLH